MDVRTMADRQLEQRRNTTRKEKRAIKRQVRAQQYAHQARNGGGEREVTRRWAKS